MTVIRPASRIPRLDVGELWHYRELLWTLVWRDVSVRYKQTFLGVAWAILVPAFTALIYVIIFGKFANFPAGTTPYPSLVVAGVLPMQYFASALTLASLSLLANLPLVTKVYFPRTLLPLARRHACRSSTSSSAFPCCSRSCGSTTRGRRAGRSLTAPLFILLAVVTVLGIGLLLAAVNVRYRDVRYMIPVFLQVLPLLSGVMFAVDQIPEKWQWILSLNPMTSVIAGWRWAMLDASPPEPGPGRRWRRRRARALRRRARRLPLVRAALRGHDLMSIAIEVDSLSKKYRLGEYQAAYGTLRETIVHATRRLTGREHHRPARGDLGAPRRLVRRSRGPGAGHHRPQRRREVDAPEDPHEDRGADGRARRDPRPRRQPARGRNRLQPGAHRAREHLPERGDPRHEAPGDRAALRRHRRVLRCRDSSSTRR